MADKRLPPPKKFNHSLPARMLAVMLAALCMASLVLLALYVNRLVHPLALEWAGVAGIGLAAGLTSRWQLRENTLALRTLTAILATFCSLWLLGWVSQGTAGISLKASAPPTVNWSGLGQLAVGSLLTCLALLAWQVSLRPEKKTRKTLAKRVPRTKVPKPKSAGREKVQPGVSRKPVKLPSRQARPKIGAPAMIQGQFWEPRWKRLRSKMRATWADSKAWGASLKDNLPFKPKVKPVRLQNPRAKTKSAHLKRSQIHLSVEIEHRCPYCLEVVEENDRRGVRVCPICDTRHHADCWSVTGVCQVPHQYD